MATAEVAFPSRQRLIGVLARGREPQLAGLGVLLIASSALPLAGPQLLRAFIDHAAQGRSVSFLAGIAAAFLGVSLAHQALSVVVGYVSTHLAWVATNALREEVARHALDLDLSFHDGHSPGELIERTDGDVTALSTFMSSFVVQVAGSALTLLGVLVVVLLEDWRIGLGMFGFVLIAALTLGKFRDFAVPRATVRREASARLFGEIEERLTGADDLRANGGGAYAVRKFQQALAFFIRASIRASMATRTMWVITAAVFAVGGVLSLAAGTLLFQAGAISLGTVYLLFRYTSLVRDPLEQISEQQQIAQEAIAGFARVQQLLDERPTVRDNGTKTLPAGPLSVTLDQVSFAYHSGTNVLHSINLDLQPGKVLGLVGRTGSGKTTLTRLLLRLLDPTEGAVRVGDLDLRNVQLESLRQRVALVTQDVQLFGANVRDNLTLFGAHRADDDRLVELLDDLGLGQWFRALPDGLDTMLGPDGAGVSAGEAQLVAFARVFLRDPGLVVLDEATSRLDPLSEERIERAIDNLLDGRTAIVIAHRLGTLHRADEIVVLDHGRIVEHGPRQALVDTRASRFAGLLATASGQQDSEGVLR
ncbi:ABC transporter ATP-binding protein [Tenggerimyces flavus]|uniref:ABC transporter ATP-binding protein n=1 Tax=Tenggerimyces flavus TaxID=1708749 RepID=A0ABV7Y644_9ACTN|nr:ABC transporter ATP-binding protein [Tenggerimyces flavus]MBM7784997.1 ABC-type multidrug transport system fused ATPase/permease subunit [Tenggerimyces flavus]